VGRTSSPACLTVSKQGKPDVDVRRGSGEPPHDSGCRGEVLRVLERLSLARAISIMQEPPYPRNMLVEQSRKCVARAKGRWCELFHNKPMWPINGRYQCGSCFRYHAVRWEQVAVRHVAGREHTHETARRSFHSAGIPGPRFAVVRLNFAMETEGTKEQ
jgi:hypothetical protein